MLPEMRSEWPNSSRRRRPCSPAWFRRSPRDVVRLKSNLHVIRPRRKNNAALWRPRRPLNQRSGRFAAAHLFVRIVSRTEDRNNLSRKFKGELPRKETSVCALASLIFLPRQSDGDGNAVLCTLKFASHRINVNLEISFSVLSATRHD